MKPNRIRLIDLGISSRFTRAFEQLSSTIESINAGFVDPDQPENEQIPMAEVEWVRTRSLDVVDHALTSRALVIHVNAHGDSSSDYESIALFSEDEGTEYDFSDLGGWLQDEIGYPICSAGLVIDACRSSTGRVRQEVRKCITNPIAYVGTTREVGWHDGVVWNSGFYGALLRRKGAGIDRVERVVDAADRASRAFTVITGRKSPYRCDVLTPTQRTVKAFGR